jgi:hypothetical protein
MGSNSSAPRASASAPMLKGNCQRVNSTIAAHKANALSSGLFEHLTGQAVAQLPDITKQNSRKKSNYSFPKAVIFWLRKLHILEKNYHRSNK